MRRHQVDHADRCNMRASNGLCTMSLGYEQDRIHQKSAVVKMKTWGYIVQICLNIAVL